MKRKYYINKISAICLLTACFSVGLLSDVKATIGIETSVAQQQPTIVISGRVIDESNEPVVGALVQVKNTKIATTTDVQGSFSVEIPSRATEIQISYAGLATKNVKIDKNDMVIKLLPDAHSNDEILNLAQEQKTSREAFTGAISKVDGEKLLKTASGGFSTRLAGRLSGLSIIQGSSEPGADGCTFFVRGRRSTNGNDPLIVLDGVPSPTTDINMLDPQVVESVILLKDASATAVYGLQAANGAILINTKRGVAGKTRISASADFSIQQATIKPHLANAAEYSSLRRQALKNDGLSTAGMDQQVAAYQSEDQSVYPDNNWYDMFVKDFAPMQRYNVNVLGGNDRVRYFVNASYMRQDGLFKTVKSDNYNPQYRLDRYNIVSNMDVSLLSNLKAFMNSNITIDRQNSSAQGDIMGTIFRTPATVDGPLTPEGNVVATTFETNPVYGRLNRSGYGKDTRSTVNISFGMDWGLDFITKGLNLKATVGYESRYVGRINGNKDYARYIKDENASVSSPEFIPYGSWVDTPLSLSKSSNFRYFMNLLTTLSYERVFDKKHEINAYLAYFNQNQIKENADKQRMLPYDRIGLSGQVKYGYDRRYYVQFDAGYTGSEQFKRKNRFGFFPTVSGSWVISNEKFLKESISANWLSLLKIRASYGLVGNDILSDRRFLYLDEFEEGGGGYVNSIYDGVRIVEGLIGNPKLQWEKSTKQNYGLDLGLFSSLTLHFDYFVEKTKDIVLQSEIDPNYQGIARENMPFVNRGEVENRGFEIEVAYDKVLNKNWSLSASGNVGYNKNKVINAEELNKSTAGYYYPYRRTGYSVGQSWGYLVDYSNGNGYFNSSQDIANSGLVYEGVAPRVGDFIYQDLNKDGVINDADMAPIGNPDVPRISYGMDVQLKYKNFDFYVQFQGAGQRSVATMGLGATETDGQGVYMDIHRNAWTPERYANGESISYPALATGNSSSLRGNSFFIVDRNYMRLKNMEIGYSLPKTLINHLKLENARFYISGTNLLTFDSMKFDDIDPEAGNLSSYPVYRTFNIGLNLTF